MKPQAFFLFLIGISAITLLTVCAPDETPQIWTQKGIMNSNLGKYDTAVIDFNRVLEMDPYYVLVYNGRGMAYLEMERYDKPVSDFETALTPDPGFSPAYFNRGEALYRSGDLDEAMKDFETSCELGYIKGCVCRDKIHKNRQ